MRAKYEKHLLHLIGKKEDVKKASFILINYYKYQTGMWTEQGEIVTNSLCTFQTIEEMRFDYAEVKEAIKTGRKDFPA